MGETILYTVFVTGLLVSATGVVLMRTPIHSLLLLIMVFFNTAGLFLVWGAEFLAMILVVVYVGAVSVLFLFVVMMLDVQRLNFKFNQYTGFSAILAFALFGELIMAILPWKTWEKATDVIALPIPKMITNTNIIGNYLYTQYFYIFQISGLLLLLAMVGAILLTLRDQSPPPYKGGKQVNREPRDTLTIVKVKSKQGIEL